MRSLGELSEAERAESELEENVRRKDLTPIERSKVMVQLKEMGQQVAEEAETRPTTGQVSGKRRRIYA